MIIATIVFCLVMILVGIGYIIEFNYEQKDRKESLEYEVRRNRDVQ